MSETDHNIPDRDSVCDACGKEIYGDYHVCEECGDAFCLTCSLNGYWCLASENLCTVCCGH